MKLGVVMDPIQAIKPWKDTSFALMLAAQSRGWTLYYIEPDWLYAEDGRAKSDMCTVSVRDTREDWFTLGPKIRSDLAELDIILHRQDPPVTLNYHYVTALLELAERQGVLVANRPNALRAANEKLLAQHYPAFCPPTLVTRNMTQLQEFLETHGHIVVKPLDAMGGSSIFQVTRDDMNADVIFETMTANGLMMAQRFLPAIQEGDRRILLINGIPVDHALLRRPPADRFRANLAAGGQGTVVPLRPRDREIAAAVGPDLARAGFWFVGLDVIGDHLTEINVTSPTCAREIDAVCRNDPAGQLLDFLAEQRRTVTPTAPTTA
ncbi:glutathione synthase [Halothiobacillus diazotrophicus]|uniref:Glutathione synthetase n=1 Tax=Halothiobacillus diazotrophicus TaxID=1860122 RepID=A0A191ZI96_9GAMM|nr:glutathione synthase [Halothiobacillus diazotrophicus]ANJ67621.1 glutathione synthase [Halothiobacillus diazotrophicus]